MGISFEKKYRNIIRESQNLFLRDGTERLAAIEAAINAYSCGDIPAVQLMQTVYGHVHAMKGVALTLHFDTFHEACEKLIARLKDGSDDGFAGAPPAEVVRLAGELRERFAECPAKVLPD